MIYDPNRTWTSNLSAPARGTHNDDLELASGDTTLVQTTWLDEHEVDTTYLTLDVLGLLSCKKE